MTAARPDAPARGAGQGEEGISRVACRIFRERGYHATSMRVIASELGMQPAALYYYYPGKEELLFSIMDGAVERLTDFVREHIDPNASARERLRQGISAHITALADHLDELSVFLHEQKSLNPQRREAIQAKTVGYEHIFRDILRDGMAQGELRMADPRLARVMILSACNWLYNWYKPDGAYQPEQIARAFTDILFHGLLRQEA